MKSNSKAGVWPLSRAIPSRSMPTNDPELVADILRCLGATGDEIVPAGKTQKPLREALLRDYSITQPTPKLLKALAERASAAPLLRDLLTPGKKHELETYLWGLEVIDFLIDHPSVKFARGRIR